MNGKKSWIAGLTLILSGAGIILKEIADGGSFDFEQIMLGVKAIGEGLAIIGIAHKIQKLGNGAPK